MIKEEKIKEAWGIYFNKVKKSRSFFGWVEIPNDKIKCDIELEFEGLELEFKDYYGYNGEVTGYSHFRPESLRGVENNNGWTKLESEKLGTINIHIDYHVAHEDEKEKIYVVSSFNLINHFKLGLITHYQPIQNPEPLLY